MKIDITKSQDHWRADCKDLPGSPPVGLGSSPEMAVACLFWCMIFESSGGMEQKSWLRFLKKEEPIIVNGETWDWPQSYKDKL